MSKSFQFLEVENMDVPLNKEMEIGKVVPFLTSLNEYSIDEQQPMKFLYDLRQDGVSVYQSTVVLPQESFDLYTFITEEVQETFEDDQLKNELLHWLDSAFHEKEELPPKKIKKKSRRLKNKDKTTKISMVLFLIISVIGIGFFYLSSKEEAPDTLEQLIKNEQFIKAGEAFPDDRQAIENKLFTLTRTEDKRFLQQLTDFQKQFPTDQGAFDLAMFNGEYEKALDVYHKNKKVFQTDNERLPLVGYAYLKLDKVDEAKKIAEETPNAELEKFILEYEQASLIIEEKQNEIKELQKKPTENKKKIEQAIEELYNAKAKLEQF